MLRGERQLTAPEIAVRKAFVQKASRESFYFFAKVVLGFDKLTSQTHKKWARDVQEKLPHVKRLMRLKPRGTYKTTLYGIALMLWVWATWSKEVRFFYTSANATLLSEVSAELNRLIGPKSESLVAFVFDLRRDDDAKNTEDVFNIHGRSESKGFSLIMRTSGGSTNGVHPHVIIVDDPMDKEDRESEAVRQKKTRWFDSLRPLLVEMKLTLPDGRETVLEHIVFIATRWHMQDLVAHILKKQGASWDVETEGVYAADGSPRYPEILPAEKIDELKGQMEEVFFSCQYVNNPLPEGARVFVRARLHFLRPDQFDVSKGTNYCFFDPSQGKEGGDYPAPIWVNIMNGRKIIFDAVDEKTQLEALLPMIAAKNREYKVRLMRYETNGTMGLDASIKLAHKDIGYPITIEGMNETRNKVERIRTIQPVLYRGGPQGWYFVADASERYPELMSQLTFFPAWGHDDFPDVIEKAVTWAATSMPNTDRFAALARV